MNTVQCKDIPDDHVVELARRWHEAGRALTAAQRGAWIRGESTGHDVPGVVEALVTEGIPEKLAVAKVESLCRPKNGRPALLDYGTSSYYAWPAS